MSAESWKFKIIMSLSNVVQPKYLNFLISNVEDPTSNDDCVMITF